VAHVCNSSYSGGREQEDRGLKPARANSSTRPYLEKPFTKIGLVEWLKVKALKSSPSTAKHTTQVHITHVFVLMLTKVKYGHNELVQAASHINSYKYVFFKHKKVVNSLWK
jgi:hypothetical protein